MRRPWHQHSAAIGFAIVLLLVAAFGQGRVAEKKAGGTAAWRPDSRVEAGGAKYQAGRRRDPFLNPLLLKKQLQVDEEVGRGQPPPGMAGTYIAQAALLGIASSRDGQTAVFRGADKRAYFLQEGDRFFDGYLTKIGPESVTLVRETKFRSGKSQTEQVVKRLRTP